MANVSRRPDLTHIDFPMKQIFRNNHHTCHPHQRNESFVFSAYQQLVFYHSYYYNFGAKIRKKIKNPKKQGIIYPNPCFLLKVVTKILCIYIWSHQCPVKIETELYLIKQSLEERIIEFFDIVDFSHIEQVSKVSFVRERYAKNLQYLIG